ncbi:ROK family protein [Blastococcus sp. Marseille-P5729]|uniref:ROK family protein n=1 Tax=Blastococcus sp. Marseille-P5729 TaxID=2086582 RepID=UPI000D0EA08C|nr:ROK family protein [Blastococcus sp. Marseille-P5729]
MSFTAAIDIGGTTLAAGLVRRDGRLHSRLEASAPTAADEVVAASLTLLERVIGEEPVDAIGIGSPGTIHPIEGTVVASDSKPEYDGARIGPAIGERFDLPYAVTNDVNAAGVGELAHGIAQGFSRVLVVSVGTGIGGALLINGRLEEGMHGTAGELAHLLAGTDGERPCGCGRSDHLEAVASGPAMVARSVARGGPQTLPEIAELAAGGDPLAAAVLTEGALWLGRAVAGLANVIDIDALILTGGVTQIGPLYTDQVAAAFTGEVMRPLRGVPVLVGALGSDAPLIGAATYVRARLGIG